MFSGAAFSCILRISDSETLAKREFTPTILFLLGSSTIHSVGGEQCAMLCFDCSAVTVQFFFFFFSYFIFLMSSNFNLQSTINTYITYKAGLITMLYLQDNTYVTSNTDYL